jgi:hypothetical protein
VTQDSAKFFEKNILHVSPSGSRFCEQCQGPGSSNSNVLNTLRDVSGKKIRESHQLSPALSIFFPQNIEEQGFIFGFPLS